MFFNCFFQLHPESAAEHLLINSDVTKHGRANKPSTSCPEPGRNWMKDEDAFSKLWAETAATLKLFTHWTFYSPVKCSYNSKSCTTYWFLVLLCYWGYWTVAELFVLDIYLYLNYYNLNQYTNMNNILTYIMPLLIMLLSYMVSALFCPFYCPFIVLVVPFFFRPPR